MRTDHTHQTTPTRVHSIPRQQKVPPSTCHSGESDPAEIRRNIPPETKVINPNDISMLCHLYWKFPIQLIVVTSLSSVAIHQYAHTKIYPHLLHLRDAKEYIPWNQTRSGCLGIQLELKDTTKQYRRCVLPKKRCLKPYREMAHAQTVTPEDFFFRSVEIVQTILCLQRRCVHAGSNVIIVCIQRTKCLLTHCYSVDSCLVPLGMADIGRHRVHK